MRKLKNPEKYVKYLKKVMAFERETNAILHERLRKAVGSFWYSYGIGVEQSAVLGLNQTRRCRINDDVLIHGNVKSIVPNDDGDYTVMFHIHEVHIKEAQ
jgi:hypothetical protein